MNINIHTHIFFMIGTYLKFYRYLVQNLATSWTIESVLKHIVWALYGILSISGVP